MGIQLFKANFAVEACLKQVRECLEKGWTGMGFKTVELEEAWKEYTGHKYAYYLNSNTAGLYMAVDTLKEVCGWDNGDEIISTPLTFISTNHAIAKNNMNAVFADVEYYREGSSVRAVDRCTFRSAGGSFGVCHSLRRLPA